MIDLMHFQSIARKSGISAQEAVERLRSLPPLTPAEEAMIQARLFRGWVQRLLACIF